MNRKILCIALMAAVFMPCGCAARKKESGRHKEKTTVTRTLRSGNGKRTIHVSRSLSKIANYTSADIVYKIGSPSVTVTGPESLLDQMYFVTSGNSLTVKVKSDKSGWDTVSGAGVKIEVTGTFVGSFLCYGSGDIKADRVESPNVSMQMFGSGDITVGTVECTTLQMTCTGSGDISVGEATATSQCYMLQGSGDMSVRRLSASTVETLLQGSGDIALRGIEAVSLKAICQGSGDITVQGEVTTATLTMQGSGDIHARGLKSVKTTKIEQGTGDIDG